MYKPGDIVKSYDWGLEQKYAVVSVGKSGIMFLVNAISGMKTWKHAISVKPCHD